MSSVEFGKGDAVHIGKTTRLVDVRTVPGGVRVKTADGQRVFLEPGDNFIELDGFSANWHYDVDKQDVRIADVKPIEGAVTIAKTPKAKLFALPRVVRGKK